MVRKHDFDAAWKSILEAFEIEVVELLFPEIFNEIAWELGTESLDMELQEIQKEIFDKYSAEKIISDKIIARGSFHSPQAPQRSRKLPSTSISLD